MQPINHQTVKGSGKKSSSTNGSRVDLMAWRWPYECNIRIICTPLKLKANSSIYASILSHIFQNEEDATLAAWWSVFALDISYTQQFPVFFYLTNPKNII